MKVIQIKIIKNAVAILILLLASSRVLTAQTPNGFVGVGTTSPKAKLHIENDSSGILIPKYATLALANSKSLLKLNAADHKGLMIYIDEAANQGFWYYNGTAFVKVGGTGGGFFSVSPANSTHIVYSSSANMGKNFIVNGDSVNKGSSSESKMMYVSSKAAFRSGTISTNDWNMDSIGTNSFATGGGTKAIGNNSVAMGINSIASGNTSFSTGYNTIASGQYSIAMGSETNASGGGSFALGYGTIASSPYSIAMGNLTVSSANYSIALGDKDTASGNYSLALGSGTKASNAYSTAMGFRTKATGMYATATGNATAASGNNSIATGINTVASGINSTAMGSGSRAEGNTSVALGNLSIASADYSTAIGFSDTASGLYSTSIGVNSKASGNYSTSLGVNTNAIGNISTAMGSYTRAVGNFSTAIGYLTTASGIVSTALGNSTIASGGYSTAMGSSSTASGFYSTATGISTVASGTNATAMGNSTVASGFNATAMGLTTKAKSLGEVAVGLRNTDYSPFSSSGFVEKDRVFVVGIGNTTNMDGLIVYKNGTSFIGKNTDNTNDPVTTSTLTVAGAIADSIITTTATTFTFAGETATVLDNNATTTATTYMLPDPTTCKGRKIAIKKINAANHAINITCTNIGPGGTVDGITSPRISVENITSGNYVANTATTSRKSWILQSDGANWWVIAAF